MGFEVDNVNGTNTVGSFFDATLLCPLYTSKHYRLEHSATVVFYAPACHIRGANNISPG